MSERRAFYAAYSDASWWLYAWEPGGGGKPRGLYLWNEGHHHWEPVMVAGRPIDGPAVKRDLKGLEVRGRFKDYILHLFVGWGIAATD